jgi:hypothetical protein
MCEVRRLVFKTFSKDGAGRTGCAQDADLMGRHSVQGGPRSSRFVKSDDIREPHGRRYVDVAWHHAISAYIAGRSSAACCNAASTLE